MKVSIKICLSGLYYRNFEIFGMEIEKLWVLSEKILATVTAR